jgi:dipeptide/tripeptide permease
MEPLAIVVTSWFLGVAFGLCLGATLATRRIRKLLEIATKPRMDLQAFAEIIGNNHEREI